MALPRVKGQSNFFTLAKAVENYMVPFTGQVIPSLQLKDFNSNERHIVTFIANYIIQKLQIFKKDGEEMTINLINTDVYYLPFYNEMTYHSVSAVINNREKDELEWLAVIGKCQFNTYIFDIGDVVFLERITKLNSILSYNKNKLKISLYSTGDKITLPHTLQIQLRKCANPDSMTLHNLTDVAFEKTLPCLVTFLNESQDPKRYAMGHMRNEKDITDLAGQSVILSEHNVSQISLACKRNPNNSLEVHSFPHNLSIDLEVLHGETPVTTFSEGEVKCLIQYMIIDNLEKAEKIHQKRYIKDMNLKMYDYEDSDDDIYGNTADLGYEIPPAISEIYDEHDYEPLTSSVNDTKVDLNRSVRELNPGRKPAKLPTMSDTDDNSEDDDYTDMSGQEFTRKYTNQFNTSKLPPFIKRASNKLDANFLLSSEPITEKEFGRRKIGEKISNTNDVAVYQKSRESGKVYTTLDKEYDVCTGYTALDDNTRASLNITKLLSEIQTGESNGSGADYEDIAPPLPDRKKYLTAV